MWPDETPAPQKDEKIQHPLPPSANKKIEMTVMWGDVKQEYRILSIKNTNWYRPGIWLSQEIITKLDVLDNWTILYLADDLWTNVANFVGGKIPGIAIP
jgi:hypothetical protein